MDKAANRLPEDVGAPVESAPRVANDATRAGDLAHFGTIAHDVVRALAVCRDLWGLAAIVLARVADMLPVDALDLYARDDAGGALRFVVETGYRPESAPVPRAVEEIFAIPRVFGRHHVAVRGSAFHDDRDDHDRILLPLGATCDRRARALAVFRLAHPAAVSDEADEALGQIAVLLRVAVEREMLLGRLDRRRDDLARAVAELARTQEELAQARKLAAIGGLAAGVAHEINTPVQYVGDNMSFLTRAFAQLAEVARVATAAVARRAAGHPDDLADLARATKRAKLDFLLEQAPRALEQSRDGLSRIAAIVGAMKEFSHPSSGEKEPVDLARAIQTTITVARNEWKYVATVETDLDPAVPLVCAQPNEINQAILNLVVNAAHAIADVVKDAPGEKGTIRIATRRDEGLAIIEISDTGTGIPEPIRDRIFDPFFTTKPVGKGTGQGLAIARAVIVERHGGRIAVKSEIGKGTTFIVELPIDGAACPAPAEAGHS